MIIQKQELLSAVVDEEASELEVRRSCRELASDERELARWSRYYLVRDVLRGNLPAVIDVGFAASVMAKIGMEPLHVDTGLEAWRNRLLRPAAGFGLAASVAVAAVLGFQSFTKTPSEAPAIAQVAQMPMPAQSAVPQVGVDASSTKHAAASALAQNPNVAARLNSYLVNHSEYAPSQGVMPSARVVVGYDNVSQR